MKKAVVIVILLLSAVLSFAAGQPLWRSDSAKTVLKGNDFIAKFQGGMLYELTNSQTGQIMISNDPGLLSSSVYLFGPNSINLDDAQVKSKKSRGGYQVEYKWADGKNWSILWSIDKSGDLVLTTSAKSDASSDRIGITLPGIDLAGGNLTIISNFGVGITTTSPLNGSIPATEQGRYNPQYVMPIVALYEGKEGGFFLEGHNKDIDPANIIVHGSGDKAAVEIVKGYPIVATDLSMFEIRLRPYKGMWQNAVDPYIDWMEKEVGYVPLDKKPQQWIKDIRAYSMLEPRPDMQGHGLDGLEKLAKVVDPKKTLLGKLSDYRPLPEFGFDHYWGNYKPSDYAINYFKRAKELGFHIGIHFNAHGIDLRYKDLIEKFVTVHRGLNLNNGLKMAFWYPPDTQIGQKS